MTETTVDINFQAGSYNYLPNKVLTHHAEDVLNELGPIAFTDEETAFAQDIARAYPEDLRLGVLKADKLDASYLDRGLTGEVFPILDEGEVLAGSTDVSDVSWNTPMAQVWTTCFVLGAPGHSWANTATAGCRSGTRGCCTRPRQWQSSRPMSLKTRRCLPRRKRNSRQPRRDVRSCRRFRQTSPRADRNNPEPIDVPASPG